MWCVLEVGPGDRVFDSGLHKRVNLPNTLNGISDLFVGRNWTDILPLKVCVSLSLHLTVKKLLGVFHKYFSNLPTILKPSLVPRVPQDHCFCDLVCGIM